MVEHFVARAIGWRDFWFGDQSIAAEQDKRRAIAAFLSVGRTVTADMDAYRQLDLPQDSEGGTFLTERMALHLYRAVCAPIDTQRTPKAVLFPSGYHHLDSTVEDYFRNVLSVDQTFSPQDSIQDRGLKRAIDYAAQDLVAFAIRDIQRDPREVPVFADRVEQTFHIRKREHPPMENVHLYLAPRITTEEGKMLTTQFTHHREEIARFRTRK